MMRVCKQHQHKHKYMQVSVDNVEDEEGSTTASSSSPTSSSLNNKPALYMMLIGSVMLVTITWWSASYISSSNTLATSATADSGYHHGEKQEEHQESQPTAVGTTNTYTKIDSSLFEEVFAAESPFEQRWPGSHLPQWAVKAINFDIPREQEICFAHVGKAGGSTLGCSLGFSLHCHGEHVASSLLAKLTTHTFHKDVYNCDDDSGYFLLVIRDPIDRARSAFNYDRPDDQDFLDFKGWALRQSRFYSECPFYHIEDFVQNGLRDEGDAPTMCKRMAEDAIKGTRPRYGGPSHWYYNYQYYYEAIPSDSKVIAIRNEHLEEDVRSIEHLFGCNENERLEVGSIENANTWSDQEDLYLSSESISILCQALCNEIQVYKKILNQALNMSQDQLRVSLRELEAKCPDQVIAEECSDAMPDISEKLRENRGY
ncbi:hypothetical protein ACHAWC_001154 [Mediolabrus comicus]